MSRRPPAWQVIALVVVIAFVLDWFIQRPDAPARELNAQIEARASEALRAYPYPFRVLRVENGTAVMSTPRNVDVPAFRFLAVIHPDIDVRDRHDPAFVAAQARLAAAQSEARAIVEAAPGIRAVRWELDRHWLAAHGIEVPDRP
ncbi:MAG: hypothetical protein KDH20_00655 [Rhodocyclaceae bacterium]|nr:hypothetical protein [Rhodocyclaceae bacterium]